MAFLNLNSLKFKLCEKSKPLLKAVIGQVQLINKFCLFVNGRNPKELFFVCQQVNESMTQLINRTS